MGDEMKRFQRELQQNRIVDDLISEIRAIRDDEELKMIQARNNELRDEIIYEQQRHNL